VGLQWSVGHLATYSSAIVMTTLAAESYVVFVGAGVSCTRSLMILF
jgi:hypothetical protein